MKKDWVLSQDTFDAMLTWLGPDRERAAEKYELIRFRLIKIFVCNHCADAEELADETFNRVASKVSELSRSWSGDPALCFYGFARNIFSEWRRRAMKQRSMEDAPTIATVIDANNNDEDPEHECLEKCMKNRREDERTLLLEYHRQQGQAKIEHHKALAAQMGITHNALRIRVHRILRKVRKCVSDCLEAQPAN